MFVEVVVEVEVAGGGAVVEVEQQAEENRSSLSPPIHLFSDTRSIAAIRLRSSSLLRNSGQ